MHNKGGIFMRTKILLAAGLAVMASAGLALPASAEASDYTMSPAGWPL
jgi:hypothetical protein